MLKNILNHLLDLKINNLKLYNFKKTNPYYQYIIIGDCNNRKSNAVLQRLKKDEKIIIKSFEGLNSEWVLIDLGDTIVHLFNNLDVRKEFNLDLMFEKFLDQKKLLALDNDDKK